MFIVRIKTKKRKAIAWTYQQSLFHVPYRRTNWIFSRHDFNNLEQKFHKNAPGYRRKTSGGHVSKLFI